MRPRKMSLISISTNPRVCRPTSRPCKRLLARSSIAAQISSRTAHGDLTDHERIAQPRGPEIGCEFTSGGLHHIRTRRLQGGGKAKEQGGNDGGGQHETKYARVGLQG